MRIITWGLQQHLVIQVHTYVTLALNNNHKWTLPKAEKLRRRRFRDAGDLMTSRSSFREPLVYPGPNAASDWAKDDIQTAVRKVCTVKVCIIQ